MNVWIWGPPMWDILHNSAFVLDRHGRSVAGLVESLRILLPCKYCRESFQNFANELGPPAIGQGAKWFYDVHNLVNLKLERQRLETYLKSHPGAHPHSEALFVRPTFEVVKKRFLVNCEEPIQWRSLTTVVLAVVMGLQTSGLDGRGALAVFLGSIATVSDLSKQRNSDNIVRLIQELVRALEARASWASVQALVERHKYQGHCSAEDSRQAPLLIKAGACISGTCA